MAIKIHAKIWVINPRFSNKKITSTLFSINLKATSCPQLNQFKIIGFTLSKIVNGHKIVNIKDSDV